jgi:hypothetical protein
MADPSHLLEQALAQQRTAAEQLAAELAALRREAEALRAAIRALREEEQQLRSEAASLRADLEEVRHQADLPLHPPAVSGTRWSGSRLLLALGLIALLGAPILALSFWHLNALQSTVLTAVNAFLIYLFGPGIVRLLLEGFVRAIPGVLLGQTVRIAVDKFRNRWTRHSG